MGLFKDHIHFCDELTERVKVFTKNGKKVGEGELLISPKKLPSVCFDFDVKLSSYKKNTYFLCRAPSFSLTFLECEVSGFQIFPRLIIQDKKESARFKKVSILLQGISEWMDNSWESKITKDEIKKERESEVFNVRIKDFQDKEFSVSSEHWCSIGRKEANNYLVEQYTLININAEKGHFSTNDVIKKANELKNIFSLLLGFNLSIEYVLDRSGKLDKSIYFSNSSEDKKPFDNKHECISQAHYIHKKGLWASIFTNFYQEKYEEFTGLWSRVAGNFSNPGFWEYEILAYVSLVDKYVSDYARNYETKLTREMFRGVRTNILSVLSDIDVSPEADNGSAVIRSLERQVRTLKNSNFSSFREKFDFTLSEMPDDIKAVINLKKEHFDDLKRFRDQVAHGSVPKTKFHRDITYEFILKSKLCVLLLYWAYRDFGFTDEEFIGFLNRRFNPIVRRALLNQEAIDHVSNSYPYLNVIKADLKYLKDKRPSTVVLEYKKKTKKYKFHKEYSLKSREWYTKPVKNRTLSSYVESIIDRALYKNVVYLGNVYLKNGNETYKYPDGICILNCPDELKRS